MPNPEHHLNDIETLIENRPPSVSGYWWIHIVSSTIQITTDYQTVVPPHLVLHLTSLQANQGLNTKEWNQIKNRITQLQENGLL